jgi:hypothetical protein
MNDNLSLPVYGALTRFAGNALRAYGAALAGAAA